MKKITDSLINKARMLYEDIEDIPYAEQLPDEDSDGGKTLSLIGPKEWTKKHLYSVVLNSDMTWTKLTE